MHQTAEALGRMRKHPALKIFFETMEKPAFDSMNYKSKIDILKNRWRGIMNILFRHYKTRFLVVLEEAPKVLVESFIERHIELGEKDSTTNPVKVIGGRKR